MPFERQGKRILNFSQEKIIESQNNDTFSIKNVINGTLIFMIIKI